MSHSDPGPGPAGAGTPPFDIVEAVVGQRAGKAVLRVDLPGGAQLRAVHPLVVAVFLVETVRRGGVRAVLHGERADRAEQRDIAAQRLVEDRRHAVEVEVVGIQQVGGQERIGDPPAGQAQALAGLPGQVALVEPEVLLAEAAAEGLGGRHRVVVRTGADADAGAPAFRQRRLEAEARAQAQQAVAVLAGIEQRRQARAGIRVDVIGTVVVEFGEVGDLVAVAVAEGARLVAQAHVAVETDARGPVREGVGLRPVLRLGLGHYLGLHFVADLVAHHLRDIGYADLPGDRGDGRRGRHGLARLLGLQRLGLGLPDQRIGLFLLQHALLYQQADQVDRGVLRGRRRLGLRLAGQRGEHDAHPQRQSVHFRVHLCTAPKVLQGSRLPEIVLGWRLLIPAACPAGRCAPAGSAKPAGVLPGGRRRAARPAPSGRSRGRRWSGSVRPG